MKRAPSQIVACLFLSIFLCSCESTLDYGYYVGGLDEKSIETLFAISDEATRELDYSTYSGLFGPSFFTTDKTNGLHEVVYRSDYLDFVEGLFKSARYIEVTTVIMSIDFIEPGRRALVKVQEEERRNQYGNTEHFTSLLEVVVGYEDGWIFFEKSSRTAMQVIQD